ncbi:glycosyltransferase family 4 protein [Frigoribacterium sp. NBH87]|uniref:glycosyltransferase n=1 Tax=Frigoribacterium sp. NBH87 TaxID=2596916 RepID=UPI001629AA3E|nr:glycosyltransferase [Frigoribacterium sp. NBH87]QNE44804.1 glycosyltransferase family 4 protein [Frigoribacterium sp. NBH87]
MRALGTGLTETVSDDVDALRDALGARLAVVAPALGVDVTGLPPAEALDRLAREVHGGGDPAAAWLLFVGVTATFPSTTDLAALRRALLLATPATAMLVVLERTMDVQARIHSGLRTLELVTDEVLVDVDFCAKYEHNTGIQRVVRHMVPEWSERAGEHRLVAWNQDSTGYRELTAPQRDRVLRWNDRQFEKSDDPVLTDTQLRREHVLVPWRTSLLVAEVPAFHVCDVLTSIARWSGTAVDMIGYDAIPLVSADTVPAPESERFAHYLTIVKHARRVYGISVSAADEFRGFVSTLPSQGLTGPAVSAVTLATEVPAVAREAAAAVSPVEGDVPVVLCVGSHEPRKNQDATLFAAELLHREGHRFRIVFVGGGSRLATLSFDRHVAKLSASGMEVESHRRLGDRELWALFGAARFTVFVSLHEGFGLPVAESLALGVPVITSDFGSLDEIAREGGCLQVDPRDDTAIVDAMRVLLTDDDEHRRLLDEIAAQTAKTWRSYADEIWTAVAA